MTANDGTRLLVSLPSDSGSESEPQAPVCRSGSVRHTAARASPRSRTSSRIGGAHVVVEASRGTDGSGGRYEPFSVTAMDAADVLGWLRNRPGSPAR